MTGRRAVSLAELVLAVGVLGTAVASMLQLFSGGYHVVYRSRYASMAAQVARETLEELEQIAARPSNGRFFDAAVADPTGATPADATPQAAAASALIASWALGSEVKGPLFDLSSAILDSDGKTPEDAQAVQELTEDPALAYPPEYARLFRTIVFTSFAKENPPERDLLRVRVTVSWQEKGTLADVPASAVFETLLSRGNRSALAIPAGGTP